MLESPRAASWLLLKNFAVLFAVSFFFGLTEPNSHSCRNGNSLNQSKAVMILKYAQAMKMV
jgi:hypothetical protein